ncbi:MAG: hypothetical protein J3R72DRAFT_493328 [Linnemannia gamsii]|nr:MAG: hypothetical protein J3R72DRAFT_493328 [Linnemannia gamsii]
MLESWDIDWMASSLLPPSSSSSSSGSFSSSGGSGSFSSLSKTSSQLSSWSQRIWNKRKRQHIIAGWDPAITWEATSITSNVWQIEAMSDQEILQKYGATRELMHQLSYCGLLLDIKRMIGEIDSSGDAAAAGTAGDAGTAANRQRLQQQEPLWSKLERIAIYRTCRFGQRPEVEVARLIAMGTHNRQRQKSEARPTSKKGGMWSWMKLVGR